MPAPTSDLIEAVDATADSVIWLVGRKGLSYRSTDAGTGVSRVAMRTSDGGLTWNFGAVPGNPNMFDVAFTDALHFVVAGEGAAAAWTSDGRRTWARNDLPVKAAQSSIVHVRGLAANGRDVVAVGTGGVILALEFEGSSTTRRAHEPSRRTRPTAALVGEVLTVTLSLQERIQRIVIRDERGREIGRTCSLTYIQARERFHSRSISDPVAI